VKLRAQLPRLTGQLTEYAGGEHIGKHGAIAKAVGSACTALLEVVDHEKHPGAHRIVETVGRVASLAAITTGTASEIAGVFHKPEVSEDTQAELAGSGSGAASNAPSPTEVMDAALGIE
jgi:hypothetical protein